MTTRSPKSFPDALQDLMSEREISFRKLSYLTTGHRPSPLSTAYLNQLALGQRVPTTENLKVIAAAAGIDPTYFKEWREHVVAERAKQLTSDVGLDEVMAALDALSNGAAQATRSKKSGS